MTHPYSKARLLMHDLVEWPEDLNGQPGGPHYEPFLTVDDVRGRRSPRRADPGVFTGRSHQLASQPEFEQKRVLEANPRIIDIREQYPLCSAKVLEDLLAGSPVSRNRVMTLDFVVTLPPLQFGGPLRYRALSSKPAFAMQSAAAQRRAEREKGRCARLGWSWSYIARPSRTEVRNHEKLHQWARPYPLDEGTAEARALATLLNASTSHKPLWGLLAMLGRRLRIREEDQFFLFAVGCYFGWLRLDHSKLLDEEVPPALVRNHV